MTFYGVLPYRATSARPSNDPVQHASWGGRRTPHGKTTVAFCGAAVHLRGTGMDPDRFDPSHPRACGRCVKALS